MKAVRAIVVVLVIVAVVGVAGYALVANEFIKTINAAFGSSIPEIDPTEYLGQYGGTSVAGIAPGALAHVKDIFMNQN